MSKKRERPGASGRPEPLGLDEIEEWNCPICMDVADAPEQLRCGHSFCRDCLAMHLKDTAACPTCRQEHTGAVRPARDLAERRRVRVRCECGDIVPLLELRSHVEGCRAVLDQAKAALPSAPPGVAAPAAPNRSTFACPFCDATRLPRAALLEHLQSKHARDGNRPAVCPVCASMPWGDPSMRSANLLQHFVHRHRFDYDTTADLEQDEDAVLAEVLRKSCEEQ